MEGGGVYRRNNDVCCMSVGFKWIVTIWLMGLLMVALSFVPLVIRLQVLVFCPACLLISAGERNI
jgi:hypothetical protein